MKWASEHIKTTIAIFTTVGTVVGFVLGVYVAQLKLNTEIEAIKHRQQQDYDYTMRILRASGAYYLPVED